MTRISSQSFDWDSRPDILFDAEVISLITDYDTQHNHLTCVHLRHPFSISYLTSSMVTEWIWLIALWKWRIKVKEIAMKIDLQLVLGVSRKRNVVGYTQNIYSFNKIKRKDDFLKCCNLYLHIINSTYGIIIIGA